VEVNVSDPATGYFLRRVRELATENQKLREELNALKSQLAAEQQLESEHDS
jgi:cell shape-determining protein MreC